MLDKKINFEDDVVRVIDANTKEVMYQGLEDYEELKGENWKYDKEKKQYTLEYKGYSLIKEKL